MNDDREDDNPDRRVDRRTALLSALVVLGAAGCAGPTARAGGSATSAGRTPSTAAPSTAAPSTSAQASPSRGTASASPSGPAPRPAIATTAGPDIVHGPRDRHEVALTFHGAGDVDLAHRVLRTCAAHDAAVTVFAVGQWVQATPEIATAILGGGHELGNHTWSHQQMPQLSASEATTEVSKGAAALRAATGTAGWWFRPSGTQHSTARIRAAAAGSGYRRCVSYDVDPGDYLDPGAAAVRSRTLAAVGSGSIVSLHLGHPGTLEALPGILTGLADRHLAAVTLSRLLRDPA